MPAWVAAGYDEYAKRLPRDCALELVELKPEPRDRGKTVAADCWPPKRLRIRAACRGLSIVALDERGEAWTTRQLADSLQQWRDDGDRAWRS